MMIILLLISFLKSSKIFLIYLGYPPFGVYMFTRVIISSCWTAPLSVTSDLLCLLLWPLFWSLFPVLSIATPSFLFSYPFSWNLFFFWMLGIFFPSLQFQPVYIFCSDVVVLYTALCGSCFFVHSTILCLLIGTFNPFIFKVLINRYVFIAIFFPLYLCSSLLCTLALAHALSSSS